MTAQYSIERGYLRRYEGGSSGGGFGSDEAFDFGWGSNFSVRLECSHHKCSLSHIKTLLVETWLGLIEYN